MLLWILLRTFLISAESVTNMLNGGSEERFTGVPADKLYYLPSIPIISSNLFLTRMCSVDGSPPNFRAMDQNEPFHLERRVIRSAAMTRITLPRETAVPMTEDGKNAFPICWSPARNRTESMASLNQINYRRPERYEGITEPLWPSYVDCSLKKLRINF